MTQLISMMKQEAIDKSNFGQHDHTCWELLDSTDVVIDITATADAVFFEATNGEWEIFIADNIEWFVWELESRLQ